MPVPTLAITGAPPCATPRRRTGGTRSLLCALALAGLGFGFAAERAAADSASGVFLAAQHAEARGDLEASAHYYRRSVFFNRDSLELRSAAVLYSVLAGEVRAAMRLARPLIEGDPTSRIGVLVSLAEAMRIEDYEAAAAIVEGAGDSATRLERAIALGWAAYGRGDRAEAQRLFAAEGEPEVVQMFSFFHGGLLAALEGDDVAAVERFEAARDAAGGASVRLALALAAAHDRLGNRAAADALFAELRERDPSNVVLLAAEAERAAGRAPGPLVTTPAEGLAEAFHGFAAAIADPRTENARRALVYARLALHMAPESVEAMLVAGDILTTLDQHEAAAETFAAIDESSPLYVNARLGLADALDGDGDRDGAIEILERLAEAPDARADVFFALGERLNAAEQYDRCAQAYADGIARLAREEPRYWAVHFGHGVCHERRGAWEEAEAAFERALDLQPGQPDVLNYLGYSLVEMGVRFEEARQMIEDAVAAKPDSGYIVDSLGWVLFRMGDYEGAARELERAVELSPSESVINDHYGDALWMVGRRMEARFQWKRALSFEPETEEERVRILRKLDVGLDVVRDEEAAAATKATTDVQPVATPELDTRQGG